MLKDEEEEKRREEEAKSIISANSIGESINSINYANANNLKIETQNDDEQFFIDRVNEANSIINSINPRQNVELPTVSDEDRMKSQQNAQNFISLMDTNAEHNNNQNIVEPDSHQSEAQIFQTKIGIKDEKSKEEIDKEIEKSKMQTVIPHEHQSTSSDVIKKSRIEMKNENIEKGGVNAFNEWADTVLNNIFNGYVKKPVAGLVNIGTTLTALGIKGLAGATGILGLGETTENIENAYSSVVDFGSNIKANADEESLLTAQIKNDFVKTSGNVSDVIANMARKCHNR